jgi:predicted RNA polymerase sigma factor
VKSTPGIEDLLRRNAPQVTHALRSEEARRQREDRAAALTPREAFTAPPLGERAPREDDTLSPLFLCCHPDLTPPARIALALRGVGGLITAETARA